MGGSSTTGGNAVGPRRRTVEASCAVGRLSLDPIDLELALGAAVWSTAAPSIIGQEPESAPRSPGPPAPGHDGELAGRTARGGARAAVAGARRVMARIGDHAATPRWSVRSATAGRRGRRLSAAPRRRRARMPAPVAPSARRRDARQLGRHSQARRRTDTLLDYGPRPSVTRAPRSATRQRLDRRASRRRVNSPVTRADRLERRFGGDLRASGGRGSAGEVVQFVVSRSAGGDDRPGDPRREALVAYFRITRRNGPRSVHDVARDTGRRGPPHVERSVVPYEKPPRPVDLGEDAEIEKGATEWSRDAALASGGRRTTSVGGERLPTWPAARSPRIRRWFAVEPSTARRRA